MEGVFQKFPYLIERFIREIDCQSLINFKEANKEISLFLDHSRVLWKQMILKNITGIPFSVKLLKITINHVGPVHLVKLSG